jgi:hypothetical protein
MAKSLAIEDRVRRSKKQLDLTWPELESALSSKRAMFDGRLKARGIRGQIRLVIRARSPLPEGWAMAILLNNSRIDGIDWEQRVGDHRGKCFNCRGWHRHMWKPAGADANKECISGFSPTTLREFVETSFAALNIDLKEETGDGNEQLPFDQTSAH